MDKEEAESLLDALLSYFENGEHYKGGVVYRELLAALASSLDVEACKLDIFHNWHPEVNSLEDLEQILTSHTRTTEWSKERPMEPGKTRLSVEVEITRDGYGVLVANLIRKKGHIIHHVYLGTIEDIDGEWQPIK